MNYCPNCGAGLASGAQNCPRCGKIFFQPVYPAYPANPAYPARPGTNITAVLGFILALLPLPFAGLVLCVIALIQCGQTGPDGRRQKGRGLAIAGILIRVALIALLVAGIVLAVWYAMDYGYYLPEFFDWEGGFAFT